MTHHPRYRSASEDAGANAASKQSVARKRWALVALIAIVAALFLAIVIMHLTGVMPKGMHS